MACGKWMPTWGVGNHLALELGNHVALKLGNDVTLELGNHLTPNVGNEVAPELGNQLALHSSIMGNIRGPRQTPARKGIPKYTKTLCAICPIVISTLND